MEFIGGLLALLAGMLLLAAAAVGGLWLVMYAIGKQ
jgi:hypothetical protein